MNKHAYLVVAHTNWAQLKLLLDQLDYETNDIYLHVNIKSTDFNEKDIREGLKKASLFMLNRREVVWASFSLAEIALEFFEIATKRDYCYYHFLSGGDLLLKSNDYIIDFLSKNRGYEFVESMCPDKFKWYSRYAYKQIAIDYSYNNRFFKASALVLKNLYFMVQKMAGYDKVRKNFNKKLMFGSGFWSITNDFAKHILEHKQWIFDNYHDTSMPEESFLQTVLEDSPFKYRRYRSPNSLLNDNLRLICWNYEKYWNYKNWGLRGHPHVWTIADLEMIRRSENLFARKFDMSADSQIVYETIKIARQRN
jgi:hypothetical protein